MKNQFILIICILFSCNIQCFGENENQMVQPAPLLDNKLDVHSKQELQSSKVIQSGQVNKIQVIPKAIENAERINRNSFHKFGNKSASTIINRSTNINNTLGARGESVFSLRGFKQSQVPVLVDGIPVYIPFDGILGMDKYQSSNISQINIIKSPPSIQYGPNTLGGVINITTRRPEKPFEVEVEFDDNFVNTLNESVYVGFKKQYLYGTLNHTFSHSHGFNMSRSFDADPNEKGGIRNNSQFHNLGFNGSLGYSKRKDQDIRLTYSYINAPWNVPSAINTKKVRNWKFTKWRKNTLALSAKQPLLNEHLSLNGNIFYDKYFNILDSYDNNSFTTQLKKYAFHSTYSDYSAGFNFIPEISINKYLTVKPVFLYKRDIHRETPNREELQAKYTASTTSLGGIIELNPIEKLTVEASISADRFNPIFNNNNPVRNDTWAVNAQGGITYMITDQNKVYFNIGRKTRFPTLKELYSGYIGLNIPNPDLEPESAFTYEVGYINKFNELAEAKISLFRSNVSNLIVDVPINPALSQLRNVDKAVNQGLDVSFKANLLKNKAHFSSGYSYLDATNRSKNRVNNYLQYLPKHKIYTSLSLDLPLHTYLELNFMYVSKALYQDYYNLQWRKLGGYPIFRISLSKEISKHCNAFVSIENVLDKNYQTEAHFPMPGINVVMGVKMAL